MTPLCTATWERGLSDHPDRQFVDLLCMGIRESFRVGFNYKCMGNSKRVLIRFVSLLLRKTDRLHALIFATQRVGVFISESDGCIAVR